MVFLAARGRSNAWIAVEAGVHVDTVRTWRGRFADLGLLGLADRKRPGRPAAFTALQTAHRSRPWRVSFPPRQAPLSRWSCPEPAREAVARRITPALSASTVRRGLDQDAIKPWQQRSWIFISDPAFRPKAARVLDLLINGVAPKGSASTPSGGESNPASLPTPEYRVGNIAITGDAGHSGTWSGRRLPAAGRGAVPL
ncbi:helix-turn-helix domain-containing protein [Streptomyces sp. NPDC001480]|uniref:helix-turn-helix domain-containing protein n=1 Tax=Streptomyces sp. NPDC001480 TaxID=3364577 RepID=UPI0036A57A85